MANLTCPVCGVDIPRERVDYLRGLRYPDHDIFCVKHASSRSIRAIYSGEPGTSELIFCSKVYQDSVKNTFLNAEEIEEDIEPTEKPSEDSE